MKPLNWTQPFEEVSVWLSVTSSNPDWLLQCSFFSRGLVFLCLSTANMELIAWLSKVFAHTLRAANTSIGATGGWNRLKHSVKNQAVQQKRKRSICSDICIACLQRICGCVVVNLLFRRTHYDEIAVGAAAEVECSSRPATRASCALLHSLENQEMVTLVVCSGSQGLVNGCWVTHPLCQMSQVFVNAFWVVLFVVQCFWYGLIYFTREN